MKKEKRILSGNGVLQIEKSNDTEGLTGMNEIIRKRKSIRKYDLAPLDATVLKTVQTQIKKVVLLYPNIRYSIEITDKTKGLFGTSVKAPHYLIFRSDEKDGVFENIGFIGQQLDLFFSESGLGACWLGASKPEGKEYGDCPVPYCCGAGRIQLCKRAGCD